MTLSSVFVVWNSLRLQRYHVGADRAGVRNGGLGTGPARRGGAGSAAVSERPAR
jgi:hypothetical protein